MKFTFYTNGQNVWCVAEYRGKTVRAVAKCAPEDTFDLAKGEAIAEARCKLKIAKMRVDQLLEKKRVLFRQFCEIRDELNRVNDLYDDADFELEEAEDRVWNAISGDVAWH